jgi:ribosomal protein S18 acetylase RimI-like enzyme
MSAALVRPSDVVIRPARRDDAEAMVDAWRLASTEPSVSDDVVSLERLIAHDPGAALVADMEGRIVGTIIATWDGWRGGLWRLAVVPVWRRRGVGRRLVAAAEDRLQALGAPKIAALVLREHDQAVGFWRALGYEPDDRVDRWVRASR